MNQSPNIINWYPFIKNQKILIYGSENDEIVKMLKLKIDKVECINTTEDILNISEKFDFIIFIGIKEKENIKLKDLIKKSERVLENNGKILLAVDNKFGLKFFAGNPEKILNKKFVSLIGYNNEKEKNETYTKEYIQKELNEIGFKFRFYYPLPDYKIPNVIFTDEQLPNYNSIDKYNPYYEENSDIIFNEIDVFREILKTNKNMFSFFANSFLIEITRVECDKTFKYISFNNMRKKEYQLITKISDDFVEKQVVTENANSHYENIKNNINYLQQNDVKCLDYLDSEKIKSKYIEQKYLLNNILTEKLESGQNEEFYKILDNYINTISINSFKTENYEETVFGKYNIEIENKEIINDLNFLPNGLWDMTLKNCFYINNDFYFFDQEWNEENLPIEYILYRSIYYTISLRRFISIEELFDKYNLRKYLELFQKLDDKMQEQIRDDEEWKFYSQNHNFGIDETKQELENLNQRSEAQKQEIENLNIRFNAQKQENENLKNENKKLQEENIVLTKKINEKLTTKIKRKLKII